MFARSKVTTGKGKQRMTCRVLLLANRNSRKGTETLLQSLQLLNKGGAEVIEKSHSEAKQLQDLVRQYRDRVDKIVIVGGDGTLNAALDGLIDSGLPLGIIPAGTANDLARTLGIPIDTQAACRAILEGNSQEIDVGWVNGKHYFNVASLGLSVKITEQLSKQSKSRWGILAYLLTAARVIMQSRPFSATIRSGSAEIAVRTIQIAVGNGRYYGGGMTVADDASIIDSQLDLYSLEIQHWWQIIPLLAAMYRGDLYKSRHARTLRGNDFAIQTNRTRKLNTDGEITTQTPAEFRVIPRAIRVFIPKGEVIRP